MKSAVLSIRSVATLLSLLMPLAWTPATAESVDSYVPTRSALGAIAFEKSRPVKRALSSVPTSIELGAWTAPRKQAEEGPPVIGNARNSPATDSIEALSEMLNWGPTPGGGWVASVSIRSPSATGLRLGLSVGALPANAVLRIYGNDHRISDHEIPAEQVLRVLSANAVDGQTGASEHVWWAPSTQGEQVTLEVELSPDTATSALKIAIPNVIHIHGSALQAVSFAGDELSYSLPCQIDSSCQAAPVEEQRRAVVRMIIVKKGTMYACSGTLLNDKAKSGIPYLLTAEHCVPDQAAASSVETDWFYWANHCGAEYPTPATKRLQTGAVLLHASYPKDVALLRLNDMPPAGAVYAGWSTDYLSTFSQLHGLHHPRGDMQKFSEGSLQASIACDRVEGGFLCNEGIRGTYMRVHWSRGLAEPGSSGSAIFHNGKVAGVASFAPQVLTCGAQNSAGYASFSGVYHELKKWLSAATPPVPPDGARGPVYRFFNPQTGAHFYTNSTAERDFVIATYPVFKYENVAFYAADESRVNLQAVYRFFNRQTGAHFYTISEAERDYVKVTFPVFEYEGLSWYASKTPLVGMVPTFRFFNRTTGAHFYTSLASERDFVLSNYPAFQYEGIAYYAWNTP